MSIRGRGAVSNERFVKVWQESSSGAEVADNLNLTRQAVHQRAVWLRKKGVNLKRFDRGWNRLTSDDVAKLNELCK